jgi:hypothetical protein
MQKQKCSLELYSNFLLASQSRYSAAELARVSPDDNLMSHDAVNKWLKKSDFKPAEIWNQAKPLVHRQTGYLVADDSVLDKRYSRNNELVKLQYSGNEHGLIKGIDLVNLLWTDGSKFIPVDYRVYRKDVDGKDKNDLWLEMLKRAVNREFSPLYVLMDSWYGSVKNLKFIRKQNWHFICNLKSNRKVSVTKGIYVSIQDLSLTNKQVKKVWLKEYGNILVCKLVAKNGDITYLATSDLSLTNYRNFTGHFSHRWKIEEFHRGIKQTTGIEKCYSIKSQSQQTHIFAAFMTFFKLERARIAEGVSWYEQKISITRISIANYLNYAKA